MSTLQKLPTAPRDDYLGDIFKNIVQRTLTRWPGLITRQDSIVDHPGGDPPSDSISDVNVPFSQGIKHR